MSVAFSTNLEASVEAFFSKLLEGILIFYVVKDTLCDRERIQRFSWVLLFTVFLMTLDGATQFIWGKDFLRGRVMHKGIYLGASFGNPNNFAGWLILFLPYLFMLIFEVPRQTYFRTKQVFLFGLCFLSLLNFFVTDSRGAFFGFFLSCGFLASVLLKDQLGLPVKRILFVLLVVTLILLSIFYWWLPLSNSEIYKAVNYFFSGRLILWNEVLTMIQDHPWLGVGVNCYTKVKADYGKLNVYPHNSFLQMISEIGVLGFISFLIVLIAFFLKAIASFKRHHDYLLLGLVAGIFGFLGHSFWDNNLYAVPLAIAFWFFLGLVKGRVDMHTLRER